MANKKHKINDWELKSIRILTINIQGLRNNKKLKSVLKILKDKKN